jgi:peptidyl-prolyl cis-trans isomerase C
VQRLISFTVVVLLLAACSKASTSASASAAGQDTASAAADTVKPVPAQIPDVVARVNGDAITKAELEKAIRTIESQNGGQVPPDQRDRVYRGVLDQLISFRLLSDEAKARKLAINDADVDARIDQIKGQFPSEEAFTQALAQQNTTVDQLKADARAEMLVTKLLQTDIEPKVTVTPAQLQEFYDKNPDRFKQAERIRASHILLRLPEKADAAAKASVKTKAADVLKQARAGKDFAALAKQYSEDPGSAANGGDLNYFQRGQMVAPFDQAAFTMKVGDVSELVETEFGFHIIKVTDKQPERTVPLDEVRPQLEEYLKNVARQEQTQAFIKTLTAKGKVDILI